jgi:hypothetical protein
MPIAKKETLLPVKEEAPYIWTRRITRDELGTKQDLLAVLFSTNKNYLDVGVRSDGTMVIANGEWDDKKHPESRDGGDLEGNRAEYSVVEIKHGRIVSTSYYAPDYYELYKTDPRPSIPHSEEHGAQAITRADRVARLGPDPEADPVKYRTHLVSHSEYDYIPGGTYRKRTTNYSPKREEAESDSTPPTYEKTDVPPTYGEGLPAPQGTHFDYFLKMALFAHDLAPADIAERFSQRAAIADTLRKMPKTPPEPITPEKTSFITLTTAKSDESGKTSVQFASDDEKMLQIVERHMRGAASQNGFTSAITPGNPPHFTVTREEFDNKLRDCALSLPTVGFRSSEDPLQVIIDNLETPREIIRAQIKEAEDTPVPRSLLI